jgi:formiminoglutamase
MDASRFERPRDARDVGIPYLIPPEVQRRSHWNDRFETRISNWLAPWDFASPIDVGIIGVPMSKSSIRASGASMAPNAFRESLGIFTTYSPDYDVDLATMKVRELGDVQVPLIDAVAGLQRIEECLRACYARPEGFFPLIIGGDHAITAPSVRALSSANPDKQIGLIHFDAHNDVRVMDHGPTNGTPIRGILESDARVDGKNLVQVGIHGFMNASYYKQWVEAQGGTIFTGRSVRQQGMSEVLDRSLEIAGKGTDAIYVTVDIDVLELGYAPGTGAATPEGLNPLDLLEALFSLGQDPRVVAIDFVEFDPRRDIAEITARTFTSGVLTFLAGLFLRLNNGWRGYDPEPAVLTNTQVAESATFEPVPTPRS